MGTSDGSKFNTLPKFFIEQMLNLLVYLCKSRIGIVQSSTHKVSSITRTTGRDGSWCSFWTIRFIIKFPFLRSDRLLFDLVNLKQTKKWTARYVLHTFYVISTIEGNRIKTRILLSVKTYFRWTWNIIWKTWKKWTDYRCIRLKIYVKDWQEYNKINVYVEFWLKLFDFHIEIVINGFVLLDILISIDQQS